MPSPLSARRLALTALTTLALCVPAIGAASASAATLPPQGIFESCPLASALQTCEQRLATMHSGGLQVVVIEPGSASLDVLSQYAASAHSIGMSVMWELSNPIWWQQPGTGTQAASAFGQFAAACGCSDNAGVLASMVRWLAAQPGTYGYYAADDSMLSPGDQAGVASYVAQIKQQDSAHTVLIGASNTGQAAQYGGNAAIVGQEIYPVTTATQLPQSSWDSVGQTAAVTQQAADSAGKTSAVILQGFSWGDNVDDGSAIGVCSASDTTASCAGRLQYPSGAEQLALRDAVLRNAHPGLILWYSFEGTVGFAEPESYYAPISAADAASRWAGLSAAIQAPAPTSSSPAGPVAGSARVATRSHAKKHAKKHVKKHAKKHAKKHKHAHPHKRARRHA